MHWLAGWPRIKKKKKNVSDKNTTYHVNGERPQSVVRRWSGGQRLRVEGQVGGPGTEQCRCCARLWRQRPHCCWHWPRPSLPTLRRSTSVRTMQHHITAVICGHRCTHTHTHTCTWAFHSKAALCVWSNNYRPVSITPDTYELLLVLLDLLCCLALERFLHHFGVPA